jgi:hypothetical protein
MEPIVGNIAASGGKLAFSWENIAGSNGTLISVAADSEFTQTARHFIIPPTANNVSLELGGAAPWYARIGNLVGKETGGRILWSGVYGPITVPSRKPLIAEIPSTVRVMHTQAITEGIRIHTGSTLSNCAIFQYSESSTMQATRSKWIYTKDIGKGYLDCGGWLFPNKYHMRLYTWDGVESVPSDDIVQLHVPKTFRDRQAARPPSKISAGLLTVSRSAAVFLNEAKVNKNLRFNSHSDYLRYKAAFEASGEERRA